MPRFVFAFISPESWFWLKPRSVNLPMSLMSAAVIVSAFGDDGRAAPPATIASERTSAADAAMKSGFFNGPSCKGFDDLRGRKQGDAKRLDDRETNRLSGRTR